MEEELKKSRYQRQIKLPQVGTAGQEALGAAKVLVVGAGGLGSPVLYYLAAAGVGTLGVIDGDSVDVSNLNRQIIHWERDLGRAKVSSASEKISQFNSDTVLYEYPVKMDREKALALIPEYDLVIAAVDNMEARLIINEICYKLGKPWIDGGIRDFFGTVCSFHPPAGPCYHCLYGSRKIPEEREIPVVGTISGVIGALQAQEAIKLILNIGDPIEGKDADL